MSNEEQCPICFKDLTADDVESYDIIRWDTEDQINILVQMFCSLEHLKIWINEGKADDN